MSTYTSIALHCTITFSETERQQKGSSMSTYTSIIQTALVDTLKTIAIRWQML
jgi:hypothetical protein